MTDEQIIQKLRVMAALYDGEGDVVAWTLNDLTCDIEEIFSALQQREPNA